MTDTTTLKDALTPSLLKEVLPESLLAQMMPNVMVFRGYFKDIDSMFSPGIYAGSASECTGTFPNANQSWKFGTLEVCPGRNPRIVQRLTSENGDVAVRIATDRQWQSWRILTS